ncbi:MAG TPA: hypothetical protein VGS19_32845 [Streptosporangiaceae bacterium]|nr:hypothetical protein [Streptosporangiaceae bacterium]
MSVLIIGKFRGDTGMFRRALVERADEFEAFADKARGQGAIHHRLGASDGLVVISQEWETAEDFQRFFADPNLQDFIVSVGITPLPPELTICEAVASTDQF